ncbi:MAG: hypothetical protein ABW133_23745 [Polyangiaceae bacterium]
MIFATPFSIRIILVSTMSVACLGAGCSDSNSKCPPASSCHHDDAGLPDGSSPVVDGDITDRSTPSRDVDPPDTGAPIIDACSAGSSGGSCRDVDCSCLNEDAASDRFGTFSLECFCNAASACPDYTTARTNCRADVTHQTYPSCNLEVIRHRYNLFSPGSSFVYDATTHALVGASYGNDIPVAMCGTRPVYGRRAGTQPAAGCTLGETLYPCRADAGM